MSDLTTERKRAADLHRKGKLSEALEAYTAFLNRSPGDASVWSNLGALLRTQQKHQMALLMQERAYALNPEAPGVINNYANILSDLGRYEESIELRKEALSRDPEERSHYAMTGRCMRGLGRYEEAIDWLKQAEPRFPDYAEIQVQLAMAELAIGRYDEGFRHYQARWRAGELTPRDMRYPEWKGEPLAGKRLLVMTEQGFGDTVLFARFMSFAKREGAHVTFMVEKPLLRLFEGLDGVDKIVTEVGWLEKYDFWTNTMDLPLLGLSSVADIPAPTRLSVPDDSRRRARGFVEPFANELKVGVVWTGSVTYRANAFRSFTHSAFLPLTRVPGVQLFSLYKGPRLDDYQQDGTAALIVDTASTDRDFADCAATMLEMDLVITSDTVTAHIAGSLGIPTWVVLHWDPFWVYGHHGDSTPWYPSMRLFRQRVPLEWDEVFAEVRAALETFSGDRK